MFGLDVTVRDPGFMGSGEGVGDLDGQLQRIDNAERPAADHLLQRVAGRQFHGDEVFTAGFVAVVDGDDVRMIEG